MAEKKEKRLPSIREAFDELEPFAGWPFRGLARPGRMLDELWGPGRGFAPAIDVSESDEAYTVSAELPGAKRDDITIELHEGMLTIRGEKRSEREEKDEHHRHVERSFGSFSRSFSLPSNADADRIKAGFEDGVLTVEIPKAEQKKPRTVDIKS